jgi:predicted amidohydrolase
MSASLRVTLVQMAIAWEDPAANRGALENLLRPLGKATDLIVLPEMFTTGFSMQPERTAEAGAATTRAWMRGLAQDLDCAITGSVVVEEGGRHFNRLLWEDSSGHAAHYDKRHLFRMGNEHAHYEPGAATLVVGWRGFRIAPLICYDLRFPVWSRRREGFDYDLLLYVANWPEARRHAWRTLLPARAIENQAYVAAVNRVGADGKGVPHAGDSVVHDFLGQPLLELHAQAAVATVALGLQPLRSFRERFPAQLDADRFSLPA